MPMSHSETEQFYQTSIVSFKKLRSKYERHEANDIGGRSFILVSAVDTEMKSSTGTEPSLLANLLQASYGRHQNSLPDHKPGQVHEFLPIFYTLLDLDCGHLIHRFIHHAPPLQLPIEKDVLERMFPANGQDPLTGECFRQLAGNIYNQQWHWCALKFGYHMGSEIEHHEHIIPITARRRIEPARDRAQNRSHKTTLWVVEIPIECVDDDLRELFQEVSETDFDRESDSMSDINKNCKLVIKQFADYESFDRERRIHNCIRNQNGIVKCFGWYEHREKNSETDAIPYYNLVLERGTQDLYSAFQKENPPITHVEIEAFWSSLFDVAEALASIQKIDEPEGIFMRYVWHGDIKPENILDVQGRFKLADPGEACLVPVSKRESATNVDQRVLKAQVPGGTKSFAAPEKNTYTTEPTREIPFVTQGIDIWSLGCVFSVAATYVVAGKEGVKQYRLLRQRALRELGLGIGDPFHDTKSVLPEVTRWHQYLRTCIRTQDDYTARVLDIVDRSMLIIPGEQRISGSDLHVSLAQIHDRAMSQPGNRPEPPGDILEFLDDMMASTADDPPPALEDIPRTISQSGAAMFEEALLYRSLRSEGRRPLPRHAGSPQTTLGQHPAIAIDPSWMASYGGAGLPRRPETILSHPSLPRISTVLSHEEASAPVNPPITFWEVEAELEQENKKSSGLMKSFSRIITPNSKLMKGRDEKLAKHFVNRDLVYLVDNASTMANFWKHATYLLRVMVWRSLKLDEDGMELVFTAGKPDLGLKPKGKGHKQKPGDFVKKMDDAKPNPGGQVETNMKVSLESILGTHMKDNSHGETLKRGLTILVLTDGLWAANDDTDVDEYLANFIKTNKATRGWDGNSPDNQIRRRPIGIQFIRFGHHPEAIRRLQRLDDDLMHRVELSDKEIPDMVDTENADGDFYKMFLGSMLEDIDNKLIQGGVAADTLSLFTGTPASAITGESSTPGSRPASHLFNPLQSRTSFGYRNDPSAHTP